MQLTNTAGIAQYGQLRREGKLRGAPGAVEHVRGLAVQHARTAALGGEAAGRTWRCWACEGDGLSSIRSRLDRLREGSRSARARPCEAGSGRPRSSALSEKILARSAPASVGLLLALGSRAPARMWPGG